MSTLTSTDVVSEQSVDSVRPITALDLAWMGALLFLLLALYFGIFVKLVHDWYTLPDFSHGFVIPFVVGYLIWRQWGRLEAAERFPSWRGLWLVVPGLLLLLLGVLGAELFLARVSFVVVLAGMIWLLAGGAVLKLLRFPLFVMLLGIPLPQVVFNQITLPLQLLASSLAATVLPLLHVPVLREGNVMQLPSMQLEVAEACSGIRSLMSLFTLAVLYVYFAERSTAKRLLIVAASLPVAVVANAFRIVGTGVLVQFWSPERALGFFHEFSGLIIFAVSLAMMVGVHWLLSVRGAADTGVRA
jgi:exosortase